MNNYSTPYFSQRRLTPLWLACLAIFVCSSGVAAKKKNRQKCRRLAGNIVEYPSSKECKASTGLCIDNEYSGGMEGTGYVTVDDFFRKVHFVGTNTVKAQIHKRSGTLTFRHDGVYNGAGAKTDGTDVAYIMTITDGDGDFDGATGVLKVSGNYVNDDEGGESHYEGEVCFNKK